MIISDVLFDIHIGVIDQVCSIKMPGNLAKDFFSGFTKFIT